MKTIITLIFLSITSLCFSQNCKYEKNELDKFTGKMTKLTKKRKFIETFNTEGFMRIQKVDTALSLRLDYRASFAKKLTVGDGAELSFLLDGGGIITLKKLNGDYVIYQWQLIKLMKTRTNVLRYYYNNDEGGYLYHDIEIKKGNAEDFMDMIKCVL